MTAAACVEAVTSVTPELVAAFARLLPQQSPDARHPGHAELVAVVQAESNTLLIARDGAENIVGTLTLVVYPTPGKTLGYIEDVVVDAPSRGQGIGALLVTEALRLAAERGAVQIDLLSGDHRQAAVRLYQRLGFRRFETNVFRYRRTDPQLSSPAR